MHVDWFITGKSIPVSPRVIQFLASRVYNFVYFYFTRFYACTIMLYEMRDVWYLSDAIFSKIAAVLYQNHIIK